MYKKSIILLSVFCFLFSFNICSAKILPDPTKCPNGPDPCSGGFCEETPCDYTLNDIIGILPIITKFILGIVGSISFLAFTYGGVMFLISAGNAGMVDKAKGIIISAVIGLIVVFASYTIIGFILTAFDVPGKDNWSTVGGIWGNK